MTVKAERRKFERQKASFEARYWSSMDSNPVQNAIAEDISTGGLGLAHTRNLQLGRTLSLRIRRYPHGDWSPELTGTVAWKMPEAGAGGQERLQRAGVRLSTGISVLREQVEQTSANIDSPADNESNAIHVGDAYDGSTITFKFLRAYGWGPLLNLGYFRYPSPLSAMNLVYSLLFAKTLFMLPKAQMRLVRQAARLLSINKDNEVLDVACGRGGSSYMIANSYRGADVTGIDLLPENVRVARTLYGKTKNLRYLVDDAMSLKFPNDSFDRLLCLEAAFHFPDRRQFIAEAYRLLRPGGRLVLVDFMWKSEKDRLLESDRKARSVKRTWSWSDFSTTDQYHADAQLVGFQIINSFDWSRWVTVPMEFIFKSIGSLGTWGPTRQVLVKTNPVLTSMTERDWLSFCGLAWAHGHVRKHVRYVALVLGKPQQ